MSEFTGSFLSEEGRNWMGREAFDEDVRTGLWALKPFKALGPDEQKCVKLCLLFFFFWHLVVQVLTYETKFKIWSYFYKKFNCII